MKKFDQSENRFMLSGAAAGAVIGSALPGFGTLIGAAIGFVAGMIFMPDVNKLRSQVSDEVKTAVDQYFTGLENDCMHVYQNCIDQRWHQMNEMMDQYVVKYLFVIRDLNAKDQQEQNKIETTLRSIADDMELIQQKITRIEYMNNRFTIEKEQEHGYSS